MDPRDFEPGKGEKWAIAIFFGAWLLAYATAVAWSLSRQ
jgi:hypothetical protein